jgi:hypothetical protein
MFLEDMLWLAILASGVLLIGIPTFKFLKAITPKKKKSNLVEAKERLEQARLDAEAAKLNKETDRLYDQMYQEALQEDEIDNQQEKHK